MVANDFGENELQLEIFWKNFSRLCSSVSDEKGKNWLG